MGRTTCHYCDEDAAYVAWHDGVGVSLCHQHFSEEVDRVSAGMGGFEPLRDAVEVRHA